jgi:membrane protein YdbS with pleckstrin-like domain
MPPSPPPSVWQLKPWWCQPWSIVLTTIALISASWFPFHLWWITALVALPVLTWMIFFVGIYPRLYLQSLPTDISPDIAQDEIPPSI